MVRAQAKYIRMSPRKLRRVINVIRGKDTHEAQTVLKFMPYAAARVVEKVLKSAVSNAKENHSLNPDELRITKAYIDQSTTLKRWRAMSRGRGFPILKRTSHVTIEVDADAALANRTIKKKSDRKVAAKTHDHEHKHELEDKQVQKTSKKTSTPEKAQKKETKKKKSKEE